MILYHTGTQYIAPLCTKADYLHFASPRRGDDRQASNGVVAYIQALLLGQTSFSMFLKEVMEFEFRLKMAILFILMSVFKFKSWGISFSFSACISLAFKHFEFRGAVNVNIFWKIFYCFHNFFPVFDNDFSLLSDCALPIARRTFL